MENMMQPQPDQTYAEYLASWWVEDYTPTLNKRNRNRALVDQITQIGLSEGYPQDQINTALKIFMPRPSKVDVNFLAVFQNSRKYADDVASYGKPGKIIKRVYPNLSEKACEAFATWYKETLVAATQRMEIHVGQAREDFKRAFRTIIRCSGNLKRYGAKTGLMCKSISDSCMRYTFSDLSAHPSEAYASGDFEIVAVRVNGKTAARCVVCIKDGLYRPGPIYSSSDLASAMIDDYIAGKENLCKDQDWSKATLLELHSHGSYYIVPYVDYQRYVRWKDGKITICFDSDSYGNTSGTVYLPKPKEVQPKKEALPGQYGYIRQSAGRTATEIMQAIQQTVVEEPRYYNYLAPDEYY
jgi:hypothetical protein